jgi:hypothetical protein
MTPGARRSTGSELVGVDRALVVDGLAERVDHAADQRFAHGHGHDLAGALDLIAFASARCSRRAAPRRPDLRRGSWRGPHAVRELDQLAGHDLVEAVDARDTVAERDDVPTSSTWMRCS